MLSCHENRVDIVQYLVEKGANMNLQNKVGTWYIVIDIQHVTNVVYDTQ